MDGTVGSVVEEGSTRVSLSGEDKPRDPDHSQRTPETHPDDEVQH